MLKNWTFGRRVLAGLLTMVFFVAFIGCIAVAALHAVVASKDTVIDVDSPLLLKAAQMQTVRQQLNSSFRNFLLSGSPADLASLQTVRATFSAALQAMRQDALDRADPISLRLTDAVAAAYADHVQVVDEVNASRTAGATIQDALARYDRDGQPKGMALSQAIANYVTQRQNELGAAQAEATENAYLGENIILTAAIMAAVLAMIFAQYLSGLLSRQIGAAVSHVRSSSAELHAAANQQATGVKEQVTSMSEINTTINELLATSRQIAEGARRVTQIAEQTTDTTRSGDGTVARATESIEGIRRQVDLVVNHMIELGRKSQQIGAVLDIVSELAEQTNILSINATIEAVGAGESGKRFSVVAEEIRKLADRVAESAKEIRGLIDDVRSSVNTTVMATEIGSKAVTAGTGQFGEVARLFQQIAELVVTTTEAAREIELSTKQQATAVEQVNIAIGSVAQATRETEASASQTIQTAAELATTSRDLLRIVDSRSAA